MFNQITTLLFQGYNILQVLSVLLCIVAAVKLCIFLTNTMVYHYQILAAKLWGWAKPYLKIACYYVSKKYQFWQLCRVWRKAMIQYSHSRSRGVVWKFHRSLNGLLLATGQTDLGKYVIEVGRKSKDGAGGYYMFAYVKFEAQGRIKKEMERDFTIGKLGENTKCHVRPIEHQEQGGRFIDYLVSKLIAPTIEAVELAEDHAEEIYTRFPVPIESASGWEWELSTTPISGRGQRQTFTSGGYDCFYEVESIITEPKTDVFNVYVSLCLAVLGNDRRGIATRNEIVENGHHAAVSLCAELEEEMKVLARKRNDDDLDSEFDDAIEDAPTPLEHLAKEAEGAPVPSALQQGELVKPAGGGIPSLDPPVLTASSLVSVVYLSEKYNLSIQEVRQRLIAANKEIDDNNNKGVGFFKDVKALFETKLDEEIIDGIITDNGLITIQFLSDHYGLPVEEVRKRLTDDGIETPEQDDRLCASFDRVKHLFEKPDWVPYDDLTAEFGAEALDTIPLNALTTKSNPNGKGWVYSRQETRKLLAEIKAKPEPESSVEHVDGDMREAGSLEMTGDGAGNLGEFGKDGERLIDQRDLPKLFKMSQEIIDLALQNASPDLQYFNTGGTSRRSLWSPTRVAKLLKTDLWTNDDTPPPLPQGAVKLNLTHDSLCSRHTLGQVFDLTIDEVKEQLGDAAPTNGDQQPTLYRLGDVLHMFGWMVVRDTGVAPQSLPEGYVPVSMTKAELAVHFNVPISLIDEVLDGVEPDSVVESTNTDGHDLTRDGKWNTLVVEQLLANLEKTDESTN